MKTFPDHIRCIGPLKVWREDILPNPGTKDQKLTFYELDRVEPDNQGRDYVNIAIQTDYDQCLSDLSMDVTKKIADPEFQRKITKFFLYMSICLNIFLIVQQSLNPEEQIIINIRPENAGWLLLIFAIFKIVDLLQERPAVFAVIYTLYWAKFYNPSRQQLVDVAVVRMFLSSKIRVADSLPLQIESDHVNMHDSLRKRSEDKYESEHTKRLQIERTSEDQKRTIQENEIRSKAKEKEAYLKGYHDGKHNITMKSVGESAREFFFKFPNITWPLVALVAAILFFVFISNLAKSFPEAILIVDLASFPLIFWIMLFVLGFFFLRWLFTLLGALR
jgi:hypothetical protein